MLVLISISTYRNLDRDKRKAMAALHRQGLSLLHSLEAGARVGLASGMEENALEDLFRETAKSEDVAYIYLTDANGVTVHASDENLALKVSPWLMGPDAAREVVTRVREVSSELRLYELAKRFLPEPTAPRFLSGKNEHKHLTIVLGLEMTEFEKAHAADMHHAVIMAGIMVALGSAAIFFIYVIQNYYLVDQTLKQTQDYTRQVVANMANGLLSINMEGEVVSYNQLALDLLELEAENINGIDLRKVIDFEAEGISETLTHCRSILDHEITYQIKSGEVIPLSLSVTPISTDKDTCNGAVIVLRDLREIKRLEAKVRRSEKLAAIGELAAGVAHEIRNPLSSIKGFAQFLRHALKDRPEEQEYADVMVREIDRINRVVTDLLTYARPVVIDPAPVDLPELIQHTVRLVTLDAQSKEASIVLNLSGELGGMLLDANQITQALLNLLLNALQSLGKGGEIEVGAIKEESDNRLHLWVKDNGPGIPFDDQDKILDPFFTTRDKGTGLGLAIVHKIVENHQGEIHIHSPIAGKAGGTRISLYFPLFIKD
jgi:two-component system sensor histidine kinase HydH